MEKKEERRQIFYGMHDDWMAFLVVVVGKIRPPLVLLTSYTCQQLPQTL